MTRLVPVTQEHFAYKAWRRPSDFRFAAGQALLNLVGADLNQAALMAPVAFVAEGERYSPVMVMSPTPGRNLFVGPKGEWLGAYTPAELRVYPFRLIRRPDADIADLYIDEDSGLIVDPCAPDAEAFYDEAGEPSPALQAILRFLAAVEPGRLAANQASVQIATAGVIRPWEITIKTDGRDQSVKGLFRIDEQALTALTDQAFIALRPALPLVYAQLLSTAQLGVFQKLLNVQGALANPQKASPAMPAVRIREEDGILHFD